MSEFFDVAVVGGSAIGGAAAAECASRGIKTIVLEEDKVFGKFKRCTSICSESGLRSTGVKFSDAVLNKVKGAVVHSPGQELTLRMKGSKAVVFDRQVFDENSIARAVSEGAEVRAKSRVISFHHGSVFAGGRTIHAPVIVGADGATSSTAAAFNFPSIKKYAYCYEEEVTNADVAHDDLCEVFFDKRMLPGFFGWIVPVDERTARVGFGVTDLPSLAKTKRDFFRKDEVSCFRSKRARKIRSFHAAIPLGPREATQHGSVILVGDAAGQTKSTTGGGLVFGSLCAKVAGESISSHISDGKPLDYEKRWRQKYGSTLSMHRNLRRLADHLDNSSLDVIVGLNRNPLSSSILSRFGDMDFLFKA